MTLASMLAAHDENILITLSSKGLTRRAKRDAQSDKGTIITLDDHQAELKMDGETVRLDEKGPKQASCSCPASGLCRHILASIILLRVAEPTAGQIQPDENSSSPDPKPPENDSAPKTPPKAKRERPTVALPHVREALLALTDQQIKRFAGADLQAAVQLAASFENVSVKSEGLNLTLSLQDSPASVTFIAGQLLKDAAYKGPTTKARLITTAFLIFVRQQSGKILDLQDLEEPEKAAALSETALKDMSSVIASSARAVLTGVPELAADRLFDQAIAARLQAAPRLTAQLRSLAKQATLAVSRHIDHDPESFLEDAANCYALCHAIGLHPSDNQLTGSLKRTYTPADPLQLWMLGARAWRTPSGARGLTCYLNHPITGEWYETTTARAAGMDLSFSTEQAYHGTLWRAGTPESMMGRSVYLPAPHISSDFQISQTLSEAAQPDDDRIKLSQFGKSKSLVTNWVELRRQIFDRIGYGIRRRVFPVPVLIMPEKTIELSFDELGQRYKWSILDDNNNVIHLDLPADNPKLAKHLRRFEKNIHAVLIVAHLDQNEIHYEPVSLILNFEKTITLLNIQIDQIEYRRLVGRKSFKLRDFFPRFEPPISPSQNQSTRELLDLVMDSLVAIITSPARLDQLKQLQQKCEQAELTILAQCIDQVRQNPIDDEILKTVYAVNETRYLMLATSME